MFGLATAVAIRGDILRKIPSTNPIYQVYHADQAAYEVAHVIEADLFLPVFYSIRIDKRQPDPRKKTNGAGLPNDLPHFCLYRLSYFFISSPHYVSGYS